MNLHFVFFSKNKHLYLYSLTILLKLHESGVELM
uniref:Uncharacterized protein n=1 Tax=Anguilla anguilla TaxID=7936 RepID=A0A0E9UCT5_ANGAN